MSNVSSAREFFEVALPKNLSDDPDKLRSLNAVYQFNISGEPGGKWIMSIAEGKATVSEGETADAKCFVTMTENDFVDLVNKKLNPQMAFMTGKVKIAGDIGLAMKLGAVIG